MNSINRPMGRPDLYPLALAWAVVAKLGFVHALAWGESLLPASGEKVDARSAAG
jgi:hypothetical protein